MSLDSLQQRNLSIKEELNELSSVIDIHEKEQKKSELEKDANSLKDSLQSRISLLDNKTDEVSKAELQRTRELLQETEESLSQLSDLNDIVEESSLQTSEVTMDVDPTKDTSSNDQETPQGEEKNFFQKGKEWIGEQASALVSAEEWKEHPGKNLFRVASGAGAVYLAYKGIKGIRDWAFWEKKEKKQKEKDSSDNKEKGSWWKKALTWLGIWAGGTYVGRWLITGKWDIFGRNPFSKEKEEWAWKETVPWTDIGSRGKEYLTLPEAEYAKYESLSWVINDYYTSAIGETNGNSGIEIMLGDSPFETKDNKKMSGLVPYVLNARYANVWAMLQEQAFMYEVVGTETNIFRWKMKNMWVDALKTLLLPLAWTVDGIIPAFLEFDTKQNLDQLLEKLKSLPELEWHLRAVFRKSISVMSYYQSRKRALDYTLAWEYLTTNNIDNFSSLSEEKKREKIENYLSDDTWYKEHIQPEVDIFLSKTLYQSVDYLKEKNLFHGEKDPFVSWEMDKIDSRKNDLLWVEDEDDESVVFHIESELHNGKLSEKGNKMLETLCGDFEDEIDGFGRSAWYKRYLPILSYFDFWGQDTLEKIQQTGEYDVLVQRYKETIQTILKKSQEGTLTSQDLTLLEQDIQDYYIFQKSLVTSQLNMQESRDQNGNVIVKWVSTVYISWETLVSGISSVWNGDVREKVKGWATVAGAAVSLDVLLYPIRLGWNTLHLRPTRLPVGVKQVWSLWKYALNVSGKSIWKGVLRSTADYLPSKLTQYAFNENTLRIALCKWDISLETAAKIAKQKGLKITAHPNSPVISSVEDVLEHVLGKSRADYKQIASLLEKYGDNPKLYSMVFEGSYDNRKLFRPKDRFKLDKTKVKFTLNEWNIQALRNISTKMDSLISPIEREVFQSLMMKTKDLSQAERIIQLGIDPKYLSLFDGTWVSSKKFWSYIAKYWGKLDTESRTSLQKFLLDAKNANKIGNNPALFIRNSFRNIDHLKGNFSLQQVDDLKLNSSKRTRIAETTKTNTSKMLHSLENVAKNSRFKPFHTSISNQISSLKDFSKTITPDSMKALQSMEKFSGISGFAHMGSEGVQVLSKVNVLLQQKGNGEILLKALQNTRSLSQISDELLKAGLSADEIAKIPQDVLAKMGNVKHGKQIRDIVSYGAHYESVGTVKKLLTNPAMKYAGRVVGRALIIGDAALNIYNFSEKYSEAQEIKQYNLERGEWREDQSYFELTTGGVWVVAGACMFIPGAGWVAGGVLFAAMGVQALGNKYYEDIDKFKQNYTDFTRKSLPAIKQELVSINGRGQWIDHTFLDKMIPSSAEKKRLWLTPTTTDAVKALIYLEESQNYPFSYYDLNDPKVLNDPELKNLVESHKKLVNEKTEKRFAYIKKTYINKDLPLVDKVKYSHNAALSSLDNLLQESSVHEILLNDEHYENKYDIDTYKKQRSENLMKTNPMFYGNLESLFDNRYRELFLLYAQLPYYQSKLHEFPPEQQEEYSALETNINFFEDYMQYKMLGKPLSSWPKVDLDPDAIDYNHLDSLLRDFLVAPTSLQVAELKDRANFLTDLQFQEKYNISPNLGQNILFEIAWTLNYTGENDLDQLKMFYSESQRNIHGIYFAEKDQKRYLNEINGRDNVFATDTELNSVERISYMQTKIKDARDSFWTGRMIAESKTTNTELLNKFIAIVDENLSLRNNKEEIRTELRNYIFQHSQQEEYIKLPLDMMIKGTKSWISWLAACTYVVKSWKIYYKTTLDGIKSEL